MAQSTALAQGLPGAAIAEVSTLTLSQELGAQYSTGSLQGNISLLKCYITDICGVQETKGAHLRPDKIHSLLHPSMR